MPQKEIIKKMLMTEVTKSALILEAGDLEKFKQLRATQDKLFELLRDGIFSDEDQDSPSVEEELTECKIKPEISSYDGKLFEFYRKKQDLQPIYQEFYDQDQALLQNPEQRFKKYIEARAKYSKQGFPTNSYAISLERYNKRNEPVVEKTPVFVPTPSVEVKSKPKIFTTKELRPKKLEKEPELLASGTFELRVIGGNVGEFHFSELYVRFLGLQEGQLIEVYDKRQNTIPFTVKQLGFAENSGPSAIRNFNLGLVEEDEETGSLYIERNINNDFLANKLSVPVFYPTLQTISHYHLKVDDVVELRWIDNEPESLAVSWKYRLSDLTGDEETKREVIRKQKKEKVLGIQTSEIHQFDLEGRSILIVGGSPFWSRWREVIEKNNGELLTYDSHKPDRALFQAQVAQSDLILFVQNMMSHASAYMGKDLAKDYKKPFIFFQNFGNSIVFDKIKELLEQIKAQESNEQTIEKLTFDNFVRAYQHILPKILTTKDTEEVRHLASIFQADYDRTVMNRQQRRKVASALAAVEARLREVEYV